MIHCYSFSGIRATQHMTNAVAKEEDDCAWITPSNLPKHSIHTTLKAHQDSNQHICLGILSIKDTIGMSIALCASTLAYLYVNKGMDSSPIRRKILNSSWQVSSHMFNLLKLFTYVVINSKLVIHKLEWRTLTWSKVNSLTLHLALLKLWRSLREASYASTKERVSLHWIFWFLFFSFLFNQLTYVLVLWTQIWRPNISCMW